MCATSRGSAASSTLTEAPSRRDPLAAGRRRVADLRERDESDKETASGDSVNERERGNETASHANRC